MTTWVALLRGVNVGRAKRVAMADLRAALENAGYGKVRTLLNSGNAVFTADGPGSTAAATKIEASLEQVIRRDLGIDAAVLVRSAAELDAIVEANPFEHKVDPKELGVTFLSASPTKERLADLVPADYEPGEFALGERVIYVHQPLGVLATPFPDWGKALNLTVTARNWNTTLKLRDLALAL